MLVCFALASVAVACGSDSGSSDGRPGAGQPAENTGNVPSTEGNTLGGTDEPDLPDCDCPDGHKCLHIEGKRLSEAGLCEEATQLTTCYEYPPTECFDVYVYSRDPSGDLWLFPSTCTPSGWPRVEDYGPVDSSCVGTWTSAYCPSLGEEDCAKQLGCGAMTGRRDCESEECPTEDEFAACVEVIMRGCGAAITLASDPSGDLWCFRDTCIPPGWTYVVDDELGVVGRCQF
ncbi:MAG: hypothetical protein FWD57_03890 [Polyangiaceae bacterium]|nr:hypothetical protein [Polyangiaceae bacterium]